jgi:UDP-glucose 4-epimerase
MKVSRILILGHTGFVGANLRRVLATRGLEVSGLSLADIDLTKAKDCQRLAEYFVPGTAVVMCSAIKRQAGDTLENYQKNVAMAANLSPLLKDGAVSRFIYFSSTAVYGEDTHNTAILEATAVNPTSYYGMAKFACERILIKAVEGKKTSPLVVLRPATIYGADEPGRPYGPMGFLRAASKGETVTVWGDGLEKREFIFIDDVCAAIAGLLESDFSGVLNLVSGHSVTFQDVLTEVAKLAPNPTTESRPRTKAKADHAFDNALLRRVLPKLAFTPLSAGLQGALVAK